MPRKNTPKTAPKAPSALDSGRWLAAALPLAGESGWQRDILVKAARSLKCDPALARVVFPNGIRDLVKAFNAWASRQMLDAIAQNSAFARMKVRQKVAFAVRARLEAVNAYPDALRQLLVWSALPVNAPTAARCLYETVNEIWYAAGDTSTDYNFYTKRGLVAGVYSATLLFWLNDSSAGKEATWVFLDARIDDVMQLGQKIGQMKQMGSMAGKFMQMRERMRSAA